MFRKRKSPFVEINFAEKKKKSFFSFSFKGSVSVKTKENFLYALSGISFIGIFITIYVTNKIINLQKEEISQVQKSIRVTEIQINNLKRKIESKQREFQKFYVSNLKEKLLFIFFSKTFPNNVKKAIKQFNEITSGLNAYTGFAIYPTAYKPFMGSTPSLKSLERYEGITYSKFKKIFKGKNPFKNPSLLGVTFVSQPTVYIRTENIPTEFQKALSSIKDANLRDNIKLEYILIKNGLDKISYKVPVTIVFPINMVLPNAEIYNEKMKQLSLFCNKLIINKQYKEQIYFNNKIQIRSVIDGICIKNVF
jgi:hypothetical protein